MAPNLNSPNHHRTTRPLEPCLLRSTGPGAYSRPQSPDQQGPPSSDENFLYVFKGARFAVAGGRPPRRAGRAACSVRSRRAASPVRPHAILAT